MASIEIPSPLITVTTEEIWQDGGLHGWRDYHVTISIRDTILMREFYSDSNPHDYNLTAEEAEERAVTKFADRLKELLDFE